MPTTRGLDRLVFFTDAVTAIAITLLVLPLVDAVSGAAGEGLTPAAFLRDNVSEIAAFALSFVVIARLWLTHHAIFEHVRIHDRRLLLLSLLWSFTIVVLPLPTEMISQFSADRVTVGTYIGTMTASSLTLTVMTLAIRRHPSLELDDNPIGPQWVVASLCTTTAFVIALVVGVLVPGINFYALLVLLLAGPVQSLIERRAARAQR